MAPELELKSNLTRAAERFISVAAAVNKATRSTDVTGEGWTRAKNISVGPD